MDKVAGCKDELAQASRAADDLVAKGFVPNAREVKDNLQGMSRTIDKLSQRGKAREKDVDAMIGKVTAFYDLYGGVMSDIENVLREEKSLGSIAGDTAAIKQQQEQFKQFQRRAIEPVGKEVEKTNRGGQGLIQSAASGTANNHSHLAHRLFKEIVCKGDPIRKLRPNPKSACYKLSFELSTTSVRVDLILCSKISTNCTNSCSKN